MASAIEDILRRCDGVEIKLEKKNDFYNDSHTVEHFLKVGDIKLPAEPIYIEITSTSTAGTIAKVSDFKIQTYDEAYSHAYGQEPNTLETYNTTVIFEVDGRKKLGRISSVYIKVLKGDHQTKYVRDVKTHAKEELKNPVNKYKQELRKGDWVIGVTPGRRLGIGRISRWTNHTVWAVKPGAELDDKTKEFKFDSIEQTFTIPPDDTEQSLTLAILKGYNGS